MKYISKSLRNALLALSCGALLACAPQGDDFHSQPRETQPYESVDPATFGAADQVAHLKMLSSELKKSVSEGAYIEMHYLEIAISKTLKAIETSAPATASGQIELLNSLAQKIHIAGHDQNSGMLIKLEEKFSSTVDALAAQL